MRGSSIRRGEKGGGGLRSCEGRKMGKLEGRRGKGRLPRERKEERDLVPEVGERGSGRDERKGIGEM